MSRIAALLHRHWGLQVAGVEPLAGGMNAATWRVRHADGVAVAKQVAPGDAAALERGCVVADRLAGLGLLTGRPLRTLDGALLAVGDRLALLEHVDGVPLAGGRPADQVVQARLLARVHRASSPTAGRGLGPVAGWLDPRAPGVADVGWLAPVARDVAAEVHDLPLTWSDLHTDPAPEAFLHDAVTGRTGLIDWAGSVRGPVAYDVASAVMYLGGRPHAGPFLGAYRAEGVLAEEEWEHLDLLARVRWVVQAVYFAGRLARGDLTGTTPAGNRRGLADARRGLGLP